MKVTYELAQKLLKQYIPGVQLVANKEEADTEDINDISEKITAKLSDEIRPAIEQEAKDSVRTSLAGEMADMQRKQISKQFGIDKKALEGLSFDDMLKKGREFATSKLTDQEQKFQADTEAMRTQYETKIEELEGKIASTESEWQRKYEMRDIDARLMSLTEKMPRGNGDLSTQAKMIKMLAEADGYELRYNPQTGAVDFYKDGKLHIENGKTLSDEKFFSSLAEKAGIIVKNTSHIDPSTVSDNKTNIAPGMQQPKFVVPAGQETVAIWAGVTTP